MNRIVVDTDVASYLFKQHPNGQAYSSVVNNSIGFVSLMTVAELDRWTLGAKWNDQRRHWLQLDLQRYTVIHSSPDLCRKWAETMTLASDIGRRRKLPTLGSQLRLCCTTFLL
ncbi:MAG: hypothetical protein ABI824_12590 [Acidobacteriota bacterium]